MCFFLTSTPGLVPSPSETDLQAHSSCWRARLCLFQEDTSCSLQCPSVLRLGFHEQLCWSFEMFCHERVGLRLLCMWDPGSGGQM